jgi:hypothetical protein
VRLGFFYHKEKTYDFSDFYDFLLFLGGL